MNQKRYGMLDPNRNLWIYSAHDDTVAALLDTMGVFEPHMPPFTATVMIDLRKNINDEFFVEVNNEIHKYHLMVSDTTPFSLFFFNKLLLSY